ncbi:MAG: phosphate signaling complex protein PhoU [Aerococcus sp.]|nr:phosphate signaling complex protein PhoU [Aerococcus sp.]
MKRQLLRVHFVKQLKTLTDTIDELGERTARAIELSIESLLNHDEAEAKQVIADDETINHLEKKIEAEVHRLIGLQAPVADELRLLLAILKAAGDFERMGDHAVSMARATIDIISEKRSDKIEQEIKGMANDVSEMTKAIKQTFLEMNMEDAKIIAKHDDIIDKQYKALIKVVVDEMKRDPELIDAGSRYISVVSNLERIGDYSTNIAERIIFAEDAKWVNLNK